MNNIQKYNKNFRAIHKIRQHEQIRPKPIGSVYGFGDASSEPLPNYKFIRRTTLENGNFLNKRLIYQSPKWSWLVHNRFERMNTYHKGTRYAEKQRAFILISRINSEARKYATSWEEIERNLQSRGTELTLDMVHNLAIYEPLSFKAICELVNRIEIEDRWEMVAENEQEASNLESKPEDSNK